MTTARMEARESVAQCAKRHKRSGDSVWDHPNNEEVRNSVKSKDHIARRVMLVFLPDLEISTEEVQTGTTHNITIKSEAEPKCNFCGKALSACGLVTEGKPGQHIGNGITLRTRIWGSAKHKYERHPWWHGDGALQAHHLICSESMNTEVWAMICDVFTYDVNSGPNGVMLPNDLKLACHLAQPLHRGNHDSTAPHYPTKVRDQITEIKDNVLAGEYCSSDGPERLRAEMNATSKVILGFVREFTWRLTSDGEHYQSGRAEGCLNCEGIPDKDTTSSTSCDNGRVHAFSHSTHGIIAGHKAGATVTLECNDAHFDSYKK